MIIREIQDALLKMGVEELNEMQQAAVNVWNKDRDIMLLSPTGSGKTLAFIIPLLSSMARGGGVQAVVLAPSRELARQSADVFAELRTPYSSVCVTGGRSAMDDHREINEKQPDIIFGTPGRILDHLVKGNFSSSSVRALVIDEFDKCLEFGFQKEMERIAELLPAVERRFLLSATRIAEMPAFVGGRFETIDYLTGDNSLGGRIGAYVVNSPEKDKLDTLFRLLCEFRDGSALVFCNYRDTVERVCAHLHENGLPAGAYHGGMEQDDRERTIYKFRNGSIHVLVSTDLAARGLDIPGIRNVVHYHLPVDEAACTHRNGRTARWEDEGRVWFILGPEETMPEYADKNVETRELPADCPGPTKPEFTTIYIGKGKRDKISAGDVVGFLCKKGRLSGREIGKIDVTEFFSLVAVPRTKSRQVIKLLGGEKIKGHKTIVEEAL